jgi:phosphatidylinositol alpha-1,6-mannosyltransferase
MARVLLVTPVFPPARGGIEAIAFRLATGMARHAVSVVALDEPGAAALDHDLRVPVARAPNEPRGGRGATIGLNRLAYATGRRTRSDVVLAMHVSATPAARALARLHGTATVLYVHAKEMRQLPYLAAAGARAADGVVAVSRYARALALDAGADPERVALIHPGSSRSPAWRTATRATTSSSRRCPRSGARSRTSAGSSSATARCGPRSRRRPRAPGWPAT